MKKRRKRARTTGRRAAGRRNGRNDLAVLLFAVLFVYAFIKSAGLEVKALPAMSRQSDRQGKQEANAEAYGQTGQEADAGEASSQTQRGVDAVDRTGYVILYQNGRSSQEIPLEQFLIGALAMSIDMEYEPETLKAQAVLLRGNCLRRLGKQAEGDGDEGQQAIDYEKLDMAYAAIEELRVLWGENFQTYYDKAKTAVEQTKGVYAKTGNTILNGNFHAMSGGKTRSGAEVLGEEAYDYLQSVPCNKNLESPDFLQTKTFAREDGGEFRILERDSAGYVTKVSWNGRELGGEQVREALGLASANFEVTQGEQYRITTKGIGHGFGFDQYYANFLAKENGKDYMSLIAYFFKDISFCV